MLDSAHHQPVPGNHLACPKNPLKLLPRVRFPQVNEMLPKCLFASLCCSIECNLLSDVIRADQARTGRRVHEVTFLCCYRGGRGYFLARGFQNTQSLLGSPVFFVGPSNHCVLFLLGHIIARPMCLSGNFSMRP